MTALEVQLETAMEHAMENTETRCLLWHIVTDILHTFEPGYSHNATAYSLLAKKEAGLRILDWMKQVSPNGTFLAETEYKNLLDTEEGEENNG